MGVIDKTTYKLSCPQCVIDESASILDYGSSWSGFNWESSAKFSNFETEWSGGGKLELTLISAICKKCGSNVKNFVFIE